MGRIERVECLLVDLDDTLYETPEMALQVAANIRSYMHERLGIPLEQVQELCLQYYLDYGTTLAGLVANGYKIDYDDWHAYVHGQLPYEQFLKPDPELRALLDSIPARKYIFTNADRRHAERCLDLLGLAACFEGVICFESTMEAAALEGLAHHGRPVICKPNRQAFRLALQLAGGANPVTTVFFDDSTRNVTGAARAAGIYSVLVGRTGVDCLADLQIRSMHDLPRAMPWLWTAACAGVQRGKLEPEPHEEVAVGTAVYVQA